MAQSMEYDTQAWRGFVTSVGALRMKTTLLLTSDYPPETSHSGNDEAVNRLHEPSVTFASPTILKDVWPLNKEPKPGEQYNQLRTRREVGPVQTNRSTRGRRSFPDRDNVPTRAKDSM